MTFRSTNRLRRLLNRLIGTEKTCSLLFCDEGIVYGVGHIPRPMVGQCKSCGWKPSSCPPPPPEPPRSPQPLPKIIPH